MQNTLSEKTLGAVTPTVIWTLKDCKGFVVFHITRLVSMFALSMYVLILYIFPWLLRNDAVHFDSKLET